MRKSILYLALITLLLSSCIVSASEHKDVYFFYSTTCPHCKAEKIFLENLESTCNENQITIHYLIGSENEELWEKKAEEFGVKTGPVPQTYVGDKAFIGYTEEEGELEFSEVYDAYIGYSNQLSEAILGDINITDPEKQHTCDCEDCSSNFEANLPKITPLQWILFIILLIYGSSFFLFKHKIKENKKLRQYWTFFFILLVIIASFIIFKSFSDVSIKNFASSLPFPLFTFIIALADGFNPCAFTVLIILLSLLTYTKKKKDMLTIGLTFIITSAIMYFIFIIVMILIGSWAMEKYSSIIYLILGIAITIAGIINIKDFFFFKKGVSLSISDKDKKTFTSRARDIVNKLRDSTSTKTFMIAIAGTILLAIFVNLVELGCTAILPAVFMTSLLSSFGNTINLQHVLWTAFYSVVYILPLLVILLNFIYFFKSTRLTENQGRKLKLFSGLLMLIFGLIMAFAPNLLIFN